MFNKKLKIIIINLILIIFMCFFAELLCSIVQYQKVKFNSLENIQQKNSVVEKTKAYLEFLKFTYKQKKYFTEVDFRDVKVEDKNKSAIILLGCSFTYGVGLEDNQIFSSKLQEATNTDVYNYGFTGAGPQEILYLLQSQNLKVADSNKVKYVIYTYIFDHQLRIYAPLREKSPYYKVSKDKQHLIYSPKYDWVNKLFIKRAFMRLLHNYFPVYKNKKFDFINYRLKEIELLHLYMKEIKNEVEKNFSNEGTPTKFIILVYEENKHENWQKLKNDGLIVIKVSDFFDLERNLFEYRLKDGHPNEKAWNIIVPIVVKELNL